VVQHINPQNINLEHKKTRAGEPGGFS